LTKKLGATVDKDKSICGHPPRHQAAALESGEDGDSTPQKTLALPPTDELVERLAKALNGLAKEHEEYFNAKIESSEPLKFEDSHKLRHNACIAKFISGNLNRKNKEMYALFMPIIKNRFSEIYDEAAKNEALYNYDNNNDYCQTNMM
jgi:hypothetical protein